MAGPRRPTRGPALITLTTDFGTADTYVAEMKAAVLAVARAVHLVDVTHEVPPHDVLAGAFALEAVARAFPAGTIHVAVVDPGVGTARRGLVLAAAEQFFVGPDNGLFTPFLAGDGWRAFELTAAAYRRAPVSPTFHGRDVFAPAAAHLALGVPPARFGAPVTDPIRCRWPEPRVVPGGVAGSVLHVDRFGNLITSLERPAIEALGPRPRVRIAGRTLAVVGTYGDLQAGEAGAVVGSGDRLEVVVREGSAAALLRVGRGAGVVATRTRSSTAPATSSKAPARRSSWRSTSSRRC